MNKLPIKRIPFYDKKLEGKEYMTEEQVYDLFDGDVVVTEKIDGSHGYGSKLGVGIYSENIKHKHTIHYNRLPTEVVRNNFTVILGFKWNGIITKHNMEICNIDTCHPPVLFEGTIIKDLVKPILKNFMNMESRWADDLVEGIVVANYDKQLFGKISRFDVSGEIDEHWSSKEKINNHATSDALEKKGDGGSQ